MGYKTNIEWTESSWPVLTGCSRVSEGCRHCYAERLTATRLKEVPAYKGLAVMNSSGEPRWTGEVRLNEKVLFDPLHWKKPRRIFVSQMSDLFHEKVPDEWLDRIFAVMVLCPQHTFQVLTKRPERMREYLSRKDVMLGWGFFAAATIHARDGGSPHRASAIAEFNEPQFPVPNIWLGTSVEDQPTAEERIPLLLQTPAAVRWISYEPALGPLDLRGKDCQDSALDFYEGDAKLDWVVCGGESGPCARMGDVAWARKVRDDCKTAGVPFFMKQICARGRKIAFENWPTDLQVREYPK
jgi:protein gp37